VREIMLEHSKNNLKQKLLKYHSPENIEKQVKEMPFLN